LSVQCLFFLNMQSACLLRTGTSEKRVIFSYVSSS
jgi:hypothetical protein